MIMKKDQFWELIRQIRELNQQTVITAENVEELGSQIFQKYTAEERGAFDLFLYSYVSELDEYPYAEMACEVLNDYISDDTALYFYYWLVSQGEEVLLKAVQDPDSLAELETIPWGHADFELLMNFCPSDSKGSEISQFDFQESLEQMIVQKQLESLSDELPPEDFEKALFDALKNSSSAGAEVSEAQRAEVQEAINQLNAKKTADISAYESFEEVMEDIPAKMPQTLRRAHKEGYTRDTYFELEAAEQSENSNRMIITKELENEYVEFKEELKKFQSHLGQVDYENRFDYKELQLQLQLMEVSKSYLTEEQSEEEWIKDLVCYGRFILPVIKEKYGNIMNEVFFQSVSFTKVEREKLKKLEEELTSFAVPIEAVRMMSGYSDDGMPKAAPEDTKKWYESLEKKEKRYVRILFELCLMMINGTAFLPEK